MAEPLATEWEFVADTVMGGVSRGQVTAETVAGRAAHRLTGQVSLENNAGFVQMASDLPPRDYTVFSGLCLELHGNDELYDLRLRTSELARPWHSYRTEILVKAGWTTYEIPFNRFQPHRTDITLDLAKVTRIGLVAIGREFEADIAVAGLSLVA